MIELFKKNLFTMIMSELSFSACNVIDGMITSRCLGSEAMAAIGIDCPFVSIIAIFSGILGIGCQAGCSKLIGKGEKKQAGAIFSTAVVLSAAVSLIATLICWIFTNPIVASWGARDAGRLTDMSMEYLRAVSLGTAGMIMYNVFSPVLILEGKRNYIKIATTSMIVINITGDLANVFLFRGGVFGMGIATALSNLAALGILIYGSIDKDSFFKFSIKNLAFRSMPGLFYLGVPKAVRRGCNAIRPIFLNNLIMLAAGGAGITAYAVQGNLRALFGTVSAGIAGTMMLLSGVLFAEEDKSGIITTFKQALKYDLLLAVPLAFLFTAAAPFIVSMYITDSAETAALAVIAVRFYALAIPFVVFNEIYINYFQGAGRVPLASIVSMLSRIGVIVPCGILCYKLLGSTGVFACLFLSEMILSIIIVIFALCTGKSKNLLERLLIFPENFGNSVLDSYEVSLSNKDSVFEVPKQIYDYCIAKNIDSKRANLACLICEEIVTATVDNGFLDHKIKYIDMKLLHYKDDSIYIRVRNNCHLFDPKKLLEKNESSDEDRVNIISSLIIVNLADEYEYKNTFRLNNIQIKIGKNGIEGLQTDHL